MPQFSDDLFLGPAYAPGPLVTGNPSPMSIGVGPMGRIYVFDVVPLVKQAAGLAAITLLGAAGYFTLAAGTGVTASVDAYGVTRYVLDTPRTVSLTVATTDQSAVNITVSGYDAYGQVMTQTLAAPNATTVNTTKAFKSVVSVYSDAAIATNGVSVGYGDTLGLPVRVTNKGYVARVGWDNTLAENAGTFTVADTATATALTGDVRGTYLPSSATDGSKRLVIGILVPALGCGPNATRVGAFGATQA